MAGFIILLCIALFKGIHGNSASCQDPAAHGCEGLPPEFHQSLKTSTPDAQFLRRFCPALNNAISCYVDYSQECDQVEIYSKAVSTHNLTVELCNETSDLHKAYDRHIDCMWSLRDRDVTPCKDRIRTQLLQYVAYRARQDNIYSGVAEAHCLKQYLIFNCLASEVRGSCGEEATATFWEIALRFDPDYPQEQMRDVARKYDAMVNE